MLTLAGCKTDQAARVEVQKVVVEKPVACLAAADANKLKALLPGAMPAWSPLIQQREGVYVGRLSQYRAFADAVVAVLPSCIAP